MAQYNIIYSSAANEHYLWNGSGFDKLATADRENLLYSGKTITDADLPAALQQCRETIQHVFPGDAEPELEAVLVGVDADEQ